jgi:hypothetical protein
MLIRRNQVPEVELLVINGQSRMLRNYKCAAEEAERFAATFRDSIDRLPASARDIILRHWEGGGGPRVWLSRIRGVWPGRGWAATKSHGQEMLFFVQIITVIPQEYLETFVAHECGHILCCAVGEPTHLAGREMRRCEWLNWQLMAAWGFDQPAAELWAYRFVDTSGDAPLIRDLPLDVDATRHRIEEDRRRLEGGVPDKSLPAELRQWLVA